MSSSIKIDRRALLASAMLAAFIGAVTVTTTVVTSPAQAQQTDKKKGDCNKYPADSKEYKDCQAQ